MSTTASTPYQTPIWDASSASIKLHSRAHEAETACCAGVTVTKSLERIEIPQCIYESCGGLGLLSQDPIGFGGGDANLYRYVGNHPTMSTDPSGLQEPEKYPTPFGPLTKRPNALPTPSIGTGWQNKGQLYPWQRPWSSSGNSIMFDRNQSAANYINSGFTRANAKLTWEKGCFMLASQRLGYDGRMIAGVPEVERYTSLMVAWERLENLVASGKKVRLAIIQSDSPPNLPPGFDHHDPIPHSGPGPDPLAPMTRYDYATLHWDPSQRQYYWESQHDSCGSVDPNTKEKLGQHWRASTPLSGFSQTIFLVVVITPEMEKKAQGLPAVPWKE